MKKLVALIVFTAIIAPAKAQTELSLDSCRAMALRNNKQLNAAKLKREIAADVRKSTRTKYLPKVDAIGGYEHFSKEVSILNNDQKAFFGGIGTNLATSVGTNMSSVLTNLASQGFISMQSAQELGAVFKELSGPMAEVGNALGQSVNDAFRTDSRNIWSGAVMVRQPIYMGGAINAANKMADIAEQMTANDIEGKRQNVIHSIDETYWLVVSLKQKKKLAENYCELITKLNTDVHKMIDEGIATRADGLKVDVKMNEAEMQIVQVDNGLALAKMLLCQLCGIPVDSDITLADENTENIAIYDDTVGLENINPIENRPEIRMLQNAVDLSKQSTKLVRAEYLPHIALTGGYLVSNPNVFNGFQNKFSGVWNVGVMMQIPLWNWFDGVYKVRASKTATAIATMEMDDVMEKIDLQIAQSRFKVSEAQKRLNMAVKNVANAEENLRCANIGFREGVMESTEVMAAQTAWQAAKSQKIDAEIEVKLAQSSLKKALGVL